MLTESWGLGCRGRPQISRRWAVAEQLFPGRRRLFVVPVEEGKGAETDRVPVPIQLSSLGTLHGQLQLLEEAVVVQEEFLKNYYWNVLDAFV